MLLFWDGYALHYGASRSSAAYTKTQDQKGVRKMFRIILVGAIVYLATMWAINALVVRAVNSLVGL